MTTLQIIRPGASPSTSAAAGSHNRVRVLQELGLTGRLTFEQIIPVTQRARAVVLHPHRSAAGATTGTISVTPDLAGCSGLEQVVHLDRNGAVLDLPASVPARTSKWPRRLWAAYMTCELPPLIEHHLNSAIGDCKNPAPKRQNAKFLLVREWLWKAETWSNLQITPAAHFPAPAPDGLPC